MSAETNKPLLLTELQQITQVIEQLIEDGAQVREIRLHGRARPAIVLNRPPRLVGNIYAWGRDRRGRRYERRACTVNGVQIQWEMLPAASPPKNIVPFPLMRETAKFDRITNQV